jgi:hypothetical protein
MFVLSPLFVLAQLSLHLLLVVLVILAWDIWDYNCVTSVVLLLTVVFIVYVWRPIRLSQFRRRGSVLPIAQERVLATTRGVAERLGTTPPNAVLFSHLSIVGVTGRVRWSMPPRLERSVIVGLPALAVLSVSEYNAFIGQALVCNDGAKLWLLPVAGRVLRWFWRVLQWILGGSFLSIIILFVLNLVPILLCLVTGILLGSNVEAPRVMVEMLTNILVLFVVPVIALFPIIAIVLWLASLWYRRQTLLADQMVAKAYGRNVLLRALPKLWAAQRTFDRQWSPMAREVKRTPEKANFFTQFRDRWTNLPDDYKDRAFREVTTGFRSLLYFEPVFEDRAALLSDLPNRLSDDRPASTLLPQITELGARMAKDYFGLD